MEKDQDALIVKTDFPSLGKNLDLIVKYSNQKRKYHTNLFLISN